MIPRARSRACRNRREAASCSKTSGRSRRLHTCRKNRGMTTDANRLRDDLLRPVLETSARFYVAVALLGGVVLAGISTWAYQAYYGLGVTGDNWPVFWSFHETNFVFWIGISHAGTLISAILRLVNATWRRPVTRCAEAITAFALMIGALFPLIHLGRPWYAWWLIPYPSERGIWPN